MATDRINRFCVNTANARSSKEIVARTCIRHGWKEMDALGNKPKGHIIWVIRQEEIDDAVRDRKENQWIARAPGLQDFCKKVAFAEIMARIEAPFWPKTYILPEESVTVEKICSRKKNPITLIFKPDEGSQGDGIFLLQTKTDVARKLQTLSNTYQGAIVQEYIPEPLLLDGFKFDMRLYVLVLSIYPVRTLLCREGLVRVCTQMYEKPCGRNLHKVNAHLTNYSLNKLSALFVHSTETQVNEGESGSKRKLSAVLPLLGINVAKFWDDIADMVRKCSQAVLDMTTPVDNCFHILGFDVLLDSTGAPYLLEVNNNPSMNIDTATPVEVPPPPATPTPIHHITRSHSSQPPIKDKGSQQQQPQAATSARARSSTSSTSSSKPTPKPAPKSSGGGVVTISPALPTLPPGAKLCKCMAHYKPHYHSACAVDVAVKSLVVDGALQMVYRLRTGDATLKAEDSHKLTKGLCYWDVTQILDGELPPFDEDDVVPLDLTITTQDNLQPPSIPSTASTTPSATTESTTEPVSGNSGKGSSCTRNNLKSTSAGSNGSGSARSSTSSSSLFGVQRSPTGCTTRKPLIRTPPLTPKHVHPLSPAAATNKPTTTSMMTIDDITSHVTTHPQASTVNFPPLPGAAKVAKAVA